VSHVTVTDELPSDILAEQNLLGALIAGTAKLADLQGFSGAWFHDPAHAAIYRAIEKQVAIGSPVDLGSLSSILAPCSEAAGGLEPGTVLEEVGGAGYLAELAGRRVQDIAVSAREIRDAWLCRQVVDLGHAIRVLAGIGHWKVAAPGAIQRLIDLAAVAR
jgi:replicative DNA helicase